MAALEIRTAKERERLFQEVWDEPAETVAKRYGVSGAALAKWCTKLEIPRPQRAMSRQVVYEALCSDLEYLT